jgi:bifunctional polynucleotide phosphatase/kinase
MVGMQASGKSSFVKKHLVPKGRFARCFLLYVGYVRINRDTLKTQEKCVSEAKKSLSEGRSVVIDNTNPDVASRAKYINLAKQLNIPCRCFVMTTPRKLAEHLNVFRELLSGGKAPRIPDIAYNVYQKKFKEPSESEGFTQIIKCNFIPEFSNLREKELFLRWS